MAEYKTAEEQGVAIKGIEDAVTVMADGLENFADTFEARYDKRTDAKLKSIIGAIQDGRAPNLYANTDSRDLTDDAGFESFGEFASAVRFNPTDKRLREINDKREMSGLTGSGGGYAIPDGFVNQLFQVPFGSAIFPSRITMLPRGTGAPDAPVSFPCLNQSGSNGLNAGVEVSYVSEGGEKPETDAGLNLVTLEPLEIAAKIVVTDKLLRNWSEATSILPGLLGQAVSTKIDQDIYSGTGAGQILGFRGHSSAISVARSVASQVNLIDLTNMLSRALFTMGPLCWVVSHSTLSQFLTITDGSGQLVWLQDNAGIDVRAGQVFKFLGLPLFVLDNASTLGTAGDVSLIAPQAIVGVQGSGPILESSPHVYFSSNKTVIKITSNFDAKPWLTAPLTLGDGTTVGPIVTLGDVE